MSMTNEELLEDFKQYVNTVVSQATTDLRVDFADLRVDFADLRRDFAELRVEVKADNEKLSGQISDLDAKVDTIADTQAEQIEDHEARLIRLESKTV